jgi:hypothetical protein
VRVLLEAKSLELDKLPERNVLLSRALSYDLRRKREFTWNVVERDKERVEIIRMLVSRGLRCDAKLDDESTVLEKACMECSKRCVEAMVAHLPRQSSGALLKKALEAACFGAGQSDITDAVDMFAMLKAAGGNLDACFLKKCKGSETRVAAIKALIVNGANVGKTKSGKPILKFVDDSLFDDVVMGLIIRDGPNVDVSGIVEYGTWLRRSFIRDQLSGYNFEEGGELNRKSLLSLDDYRGYNA